MDAEFLQELEKQISHVGTSECWQRDIGGRTIWFSPISVPSQESIQETLTNAELGSNAITEAKRVTLSHAIVGIDGLDLRPHRFSGPVFPSFDPRLKQAVKVELSKYVYHKMATWGSEFLDQAFSVFADLMETHKRDNLKDVKFENAKDPLTELAELEARAGAIRSELGLPLLGEIGDPQDRETVAPVAPEASQGQEAPSVPEPEDLSFDPFHAVGAGVRAPAPLPPTTPPPAIPVPDPVSAAAFRQVPQDSPPPPVPVPVIPVHAVLPNSRSGQIVRELGGKAVVIGRESSPDRPFQAMSSVASDVVERPASGGPPVDPPVVNPSVRNSNLNPRFRPPGR